MEEAITKDAVDRRIREALAPMINPLIAYLYRAPATSDLLRAFFGNGTLVVCNTFPLLSGRSFLVFE